MILYKYYGYESGLAALRESTLGFRKPIAFNDPFELSSLSNASGPERKQDTLFDVVNKMSNSVVILSLTRAYDNALMWSHYGEEHKGFVIAYDVGRAFLSNYEQNIIPVTEGDVLYTNTKSEHKLNHTDMKSLKGVNYLGSRFSETTPEVRSFARKIFLTKHASWVYEEEVRIVKDLSKCSGYKTLPDVSDLYLFERKVPIKRVYIGVRNNVNANVVQGALNEPGSKVSILKMNMDKGTWGLKASTAW
jgi:hypothetical protein